MNRFKLPILDDFVVIGRGQVFMVENSYKDIVQIGDQIEVNGKIFEIKGIESMLSHSKPIGLVCKEILEFKS